MPSQLWPLCLSKGCANSATCGADAAVAVSCWQQRVGGSVTDLGPESMCEERCDSPEVQQGLGAESTVRRSQEPRWVST